MVGSLIGKGVRAGANLVKKGVGTGKRKMVDKDGKVITVHASTRTANQVEGLGTAKNRAAGKKVQNKTEARKLRKREGKDAANLRQPAMGRLGDTAEGADSDIPKFKRDAFQAKQYDKALAKKQERLNELRTRYQSLKTKEAKKEFAIKHKTEALDLAAAIEDMEIRGGPGGKSKKRKTGGQVMKKAGGGKMSHVGLYPAEEKRSGTMSEKKRAQNMGHGGKIKKYKHGGKVNTSRENRLEELGRVDAEKAHTSKGKRNLRQEKKRIVRELNGNDFVAQYYD